MKMQNNKNNKNNIARWLLAGFAIAIFFTIAVTPSAMAGEQLQPGDENIMLNTVCKGDEDDKHSMRELISRLRDEMNVKRVQLTRGNCYLTRGKVGSKRYTGLFDPYELEELYYILRE